MKTNGEHTYKDGLHKWRLRVRPAKSGSPSSPALISALDAVTRFLEASACRRREIERTIDALIVVLDHMDGDPDLEPEEDRCAALDDYGGASAQSDWCPGDPEDAEETEYAERGEPEDGATDDADSA